MNNSKFFQDILVAQKLLKDADISIKKMLNCLDNQDVIGAIEESFNYDIIAEKIVNNARLIPIASGSPVAKKNIEENILSKNNLIVEYTSEGWFHLLIPSLLTKKEKGNPSYIRTTVKVALDKYFQEHQKHPLQSDCVIIFKHNYDKNRPEREYRDHDNIEVNAIVDMIALYTLVDDSPMKCKHFYCSSVANTDNTDVFLVPVNDFILWLKNNNIALKKDVTEV